MTSAPQLPNQACHFELTIALSADNTFLFDIYSKVTQACWAADVISLIVGAGSKS